MRASRRKFVGTAIAGTAALGFFGLRRLWTDGYLFDEPWNGYGELVPDPRRLADLPHGFNYKVISNAGDRMDDGLCVPGAHDGMAAFPGPAGRTIVVRNHELSADGFERSAFNSPSRDQWTGLDPALVYDRTAGFGGTTTFIFDTRHQKLERQFLSLAGTVRNCAGGPTPWGSWISCEETTQTADERHAVDHGYNFEVPSAATGLVKAVPLKAMGRFNHEAVAVDPMAEVVYQTEDRSNSLFYRFLPSAKGNLAAGGKLQALKIDELPGVDTSNQKETLLIAGKPMRVSWLDLEDVESPNDNLRLQGISKGAARFVRGEGVWAGSRSVYFACTSGGASSCGQIFRYRPDMEAIELFAESSGAAFLEKPDNITIAPWGDLIVCEDGPDENRVIGITPDGRFYNLCRNVMNDSEFTGSVFSPDESTLFVNIQSPGLTLAITGPWRQRKARMSL